MIIIICYTNNDIHYQKGNQLVKRTRQKDLILTALKGNPYHPPAIWIYDQVRKGMPRISLATVYRNLRTFCERGDILELRLEGNVSRFDPRTDEHSHFWCNKCERVFDIDEPTDKGFNGRVAHEKGFEVSYSRIILRGLCRECKTNLIKI